MQKKAARIFQRSAFVSRRGCAIRLQQSPDRPSGLALRKHQFLFETRLLPL